MANNNLKVMLSFMREVNDGNMPSAADYGIENHKFWDIIDAAQHAELIKGARFKKDGQDSEILMCYIDDVKLTVKGMEYLDEHSIAMKAYKGLKELREWLPF